MRLPTGPSVTFLFTDIEGSTRLERGVGSTRWAGLVARHDRLVRDAVERAGGVVVKTEGDAFFAAFAAPSEAIRAAVRAQRALAAEPWGDAAPRVRMGLHVGEGRLRERAGPTEPEDYVGIDVNYAARVAATGNGGQIVLSDGLADAIRSVLGQGDELAGVELVDEGLRIVKDFDDPARLHRLVVGGAADDPRPLRTIDPPSNLPGDVTALVGRDLDISLAREALLSSRVVTLTGPGGSGKTRLALGVARSVADRFPHGTWFVDLASLRDSQLIETAVASALGVRESSESAVSDALRGMLRDRSMLLVLDNLEQLLPGAAEVVSGLVRAAPELRVLGTSRELLRIAGERGYPVPPLDPTAGVTLFEERARAHRPDLALTAEVEATIRAICDRLGGLPLAIELAAARIRTLTPAMILERLGRSLDLTANARDLPERQRTLRGAIDWSHDLLDDPERRLFRRLGVFAGGWTIPMAEAVVDPEHDLGIDLVDGLESLADKSLTRIEPPSGEAVAASAEPAAAIEDEVRFSLHPLLREYAQERLTESGELSLMEARHADAVSALAEALGPGITGPNAVAILRRLDREAYNLRAAIDWSIDNDVADVGLRLSGAIWRWYHQRNHLREGRAIVAELLGRTPHGDPRVRIAGLAAQGGLAYWMSDVDGAETAYGERLAIAESIGDPALLADAHYDFGFIGMLRKDGASLRRHEDVAIRLYEQIGDAAGTIRARQALVLAVFLAGELVSARDLEEQNLLAFRRTSSWNEIADSLTFLTAVHMRLDERGIAWSRLAEALRMFADATNASGLARSLGIASLLLFRSDEPELGARVAGAAYELVRVHGVMMAPVVVLHLPDPRVEAAEHLGAARADELLAAGAATPIDDVVAETMAFAVAASAAVAAAPAGSSSSGGGA
ncbi:MAG TPA: adenylate/guanylate cyclase domain-containing protein [Candidatus Limnocylindrales bacterium]|nr:adenylate/guanylate cyclase domain-containing protein [Candidatus Limnocylindrales bacterium]